MVTAIMIGGDEGARPSRPSQRALTTAIYHPLATPPLQDYSQADVRTWVTNTRDTLSREHRGMSLLEYWESIVNERHR